MPDRDQYDELLLRDTFERYRADELPAMVAPGAAAARRTLAYRRRRRTAVVAAAVVLALATGGGAALVAIRPDHHAHRVPPATSHRPSPDATSHSPTLSPRRSARKHVPDGRIGATDLAGATLDIPGWQSGGVCAGGTYTFRGGTGTGDGFDVYLPGNGRVVLPGPAYADVDGDGADETVALVACGAQELNYQAVAFDRDDAGRIVTLGSVARTPFVPMPTARMDGLRTDPDGTVEVRWTQVRELSPISQWRGYRWSGGAFTQVGGPAALPDPPVVRVTARATMSPTDGGYAGTLTIVVTNTAASQNPIGYANLKVALPAGVTVRSASPAGQCSAADGAWWCTDDTHPIGPGTSWTVTLAVTSTAPHQPADRTLPGTLTLYPVPSSFCRGDTGDTPYSITLPAAD
ncbi:hypothetical protein [Actinocatenispora rupis]|uniref:Uncharacterized protein n=1 Tax=Actinocatenispora rupis TaxID=519421 RepID=A0A8J3NAZ4_9ACTN|nr:hypothetical protein [Actinocatenispora rupis]GID10087.1 hypothetical protein Aru02nite_09760 [Actinocatenispora rupis]